MKKKYQQPIAEIVAPIEENILTSWSQGYNSYDPLDNHTGDINDDPFGSTSGAKGNEIFGEFWEDEMQ